MARRRRKEESLLEMAIKGTWEVSAIFAAVLMFITFGVFPSIANPILRAFCLALTPVLILLILVFSLMALFKFFSNRPRRGAQCSAEPPWGGRELRPFGKVESGDIASWRTAVSEEGRAQLSRPGQMPSSVLKAAPDGKNEQLEWSLRLIREVEWKRFEELSTAYYREKGIRAEATPLGADGGIDIQLYQDDSGNPTALVQCKAWNRQVGVKDVREFFGVMSHEKIMKGFYMTSGSYSAEAKRFAEANQITVINGEMLLMMIQRMPEDGQKRLLMLTTEGDYTTPTCPSCGVKMVKRSGKQGTFWGCRNYPRCRRTLRLSSNAR